VSSNSPDWLPACDGPALRARAVLLSRIREYFAREGVLEVETPLLCRRTGCDPHLNFFVCGPEKEPRYLQTSPEFAMKRLLAAGSGSIYQICKAFRADEAGRSHNPEFTLLEWYRIGFDLDALMDDVEALLSHAGENRWSAGSFERLCYRDVFLQYAAIDPLAATPADFATRACHLGLNEAEDLCGEDIPSWLDFLFSHVVQPCLGESAPCFVRHFPACLPSLARRNAEDPRVVERVELFWKGVELANGYHELCDGEEQAQRFEQDRAERSRRGLPVPEADERLLAALRHGLPECAGMALGVDRLLMLLQEAEHIDHVLTFPWPRA
jgi:lysyl-tRNA synthetase class 2